MGSYGSVLHVSRAGQLRRGESGLQPEPSACLRPETALLLIFKDTLHDQWIMKGHV